MPRISRQSAWVCIVLAGLLMTAGCTGHLMPPADGREPVDDSRFAVVTVQNGDTFESLARTWLHDGRQAWRIAAFNQTDRLSPGQRIVIPRIPTRLGGLMPDGYQTIPVLAYLDMDTAPKTPDAVSARNFARHLAYLSENGFTTLSLDQLDNFIHLRGDLPPDSLVITMDTTRRWAYDIAYPALKRYGMKAALFLDVGQVGRTGRLTWRQLKEMNAGGIDMGLYGRPFRPVPKESLAEYLKTYESGLSAPKKVLSEQLNTPCRYFAYPSGKSDDLTISLLKKHGYRAGFTRRRGGNPFFIDDFMIRRSVVRGHHDMQAFRRNLTTFRTMELK